MDYIDKLKSLRKQKKLSQEEVAAFLETTQQHYSCYENKRNELPVGHLVALCRRYQVSANWILGLNDKKEVD